jgi:molybdate transport system ATP-binding protein
MAHPSRPFISLQDISLRLYGAMLFEHTSWEILDDQHWAVIGPNGSGKTTLMRAICGQVPVVNGRIVYHFMRDGSLPGKHVALVSFDTQERTLKREGQFHQARWNIGPHEHSMSVAEYLSRNNVQRINPYQVLQEKTEPAAFLAYRDQIVDLLGIECLLVKDLIQLSNGERRKVSIARALLRKPRLLILDNPFTGLDSKYRLRLQHIMRELMQHGTQIIVATARQGEISPGITHVLKVDQGQVVAQGRREAVLRPSIRPRTVQLDPPTELQRQSTSPKRPDSPILVRMRGVNASYGQAEILTAVDWVIRRGEHWALLGPNGSGKTTLLSMILGDHPQAYANDITLFGRRRGSGESIWEIKQHIGHVSPELHLYYPKHISCFDIVCSGLFDSVGLYTRCSSQQRCTAERWMEQLGLQSRARRLFTEVSEGEQRLVLLARVLVKNPLLLVLDEPCQGLDGPNKTRILQVVDAIGKQLDTSIIYVTHDTDQLPQVITRIMRLNGGRVAESSTSTSAPTVELAGQRIVV